MGATLEAIALLVALSAIIGFVTLFLFGLAVRLRHSNIAHRCAARHPNVIYNPDADKRSVQFRGNPWLGWVPWVLSLSYEDMLNGIPGTGTRMGGYAGTFLRANVDAIVLIRFHELGLRISFFAMCLYFFILFPIYYTARCHHFNKYDEDVIGCDPEVYNLTNYDRLTLANIVPLDLNETNDVWGQTRLSARLYTVVFLSWILTIFACFELVQEWIEILAMRRVYYLEYDHWSGRKAELNKTYFSRTKEEEKIERDPWIPDPEQRETVPNIALYSVLVSGLPSLPGEEAGDVEEAMKHSKKQNIDWQLAVTASFFDKCVPNQPGFSSSVAAVTILPGASEIAIAWSKWYTAASKLRRLRFIRKQIASRRHYDIEDGEAKTPDDDDYDYDDDENGDRNEVPSEPQNRDNVIYANNTRRKAYNRAILGSDPHDRLDEHVEDKFLDALNFGPEQTAVYSREFAQSAAACCPNGCAEHRITRATIDELIEMEEEAIQEVHEANLCLKEAQVMATFFDVDINAEENDESSDKNSELENNGHHRAGSKSNIELPTVMPKGLDLEAKLYRQSSVVEESETNGKDKLSTIASFSDKFSNAQYSALENSSTAGYCGLAQADPWTTKRNKNTANWELVNLFAKESESETECDNGRWVLPSSCRDCVNRGVKKARKIWRWVTSKSSQVVVDVKDVVSRESTHAVVTFTSRQAALAARQCLADGRGNLRWISIDKIPVPPLADAAPCRLCPCRGCCRPVTVNIHDRQKSTRYQCGMLGLACMYVFFSIPLNLASTHIVGPEDLDKLAGYLGGWEKILGFLYSPDIAYKVDGILTAGLFALFFSVCPVIFKTIANFASTATSVVSADHSALQYYWWFMLVSAFWSTSLYGMVKDGFDEGFRIGADFNTVVATVAKTIPSQTSATWLYWIIFRCGITLPTQYMLQMNTFLFDFLKLRCCARQTRGGGPGGPVPYRIYVDSGVVLLCVFALAPAAPLITPISVVYFLICSPLLRRNVIFMYRPRYDAGGIRWPFLFDMCISCILVSQLLLTGMMALKQALGPTILAFIPFFPTLYFRSDVRRRYLKSFNDTALLQTSLLDGWDTDEPIPMEKREEFRRFLVDAHKAAYIPVCIAGTSGETVLTAEPAVVIKTENDNDYEFPDMEPPHRGRRSNDFNEASRERLSSMSTSDITLASRNQYGATLRRVTSTLQTRARTSSMEHTTKVRTSSLDMLSFNDDGSVRLNWTPSPKQAAYTKLKQNM